MLDEDIKACALRLLARREHSQFELTQKLQARGFTLEQISLVLEQLAQTKLQSDERFTENYAHFRAERGFGPYRISQELREYGVSKELISKFVDVKDPLWQERAQQVIYKKFGANPAQDFPTRVKISKFLQYRGFDSVW